MYILSKRSLLYDKEKDYPYLLIYYQIIIENEIIKNVYKLANFNIIIINIFNIKYNLNKIIINIQVLALLILCSYYFIFNNKIIYN